MSPSQPENTSPAPDEIVLPPGVVFSTSPDCAWAWGRLLRLAYELEFQQEES